MFTSLKGEIEKAEIGGMVREHDIVKFEKLKKHLRAIIAGKRLKYPLARIDCGFKKQYRNMKK